MGLQHFSTEPKLGIDCKIRRKNQENSKQNDGIYFEYNESRKNSDESNKSKLKNNLDAIIVNKAIKMEMGWISCKTK